MRLAFVICILCYTSDVVRSDNYAKDNNDVEKLFEFVWEALEAIAKFVPLHPDTDLNISQLLNKYGYPFEEHNVTTEDGHILTMHRIAHGRNETITEKKRPVVFMKHCVACSSMIFLYSGPENSLAMLLADQGYDVWLCNTRGNIYTSHTTLDPNKDSDYWDFSFHEKGYYDIPASVDYMLKYTKVDNFTFLGFSQGTTEGLVFTTMRPEYVEKINLMALLSPVAYMGNSSGLIPRLLSENQELIELTFGLLGIHSVPFTPLIPLLGKVFCNDASSVQDVCPLIMDFIVGFDLPQVNKTLLTVFLASSPDGISIKELYHFGQEIRSGYFRQYDYGVGNLIRYGSLEPPSYNVSKITCPVAAYYGKNDFFVATKDVEHLFQQLPNVVVSHLLEYEAFNHLDFVTAIDVKAMVYDMLFETIKKFNPPNKS
ncbi:lipase 3-like [Sitophilus oryzae]|uniref:Lipase n=1 Tax=Sitophilus oryzae TaxID=7048 RepID=A0A6J2YV07_SITOR|nr:lipase 3-like [Sitophilus oryzae]